MINSTRLFLICCLILLCMREVQAQETVLTANGNATGSEGTVCYSVGQIAYLTKTDAEGTVSEGIQQPFEVIIPIGIDNEKGIGLECKVYPNPADRYIILKVEKRDFSQMNYQLFNSNGILLQDNKIAGEETLLSLDGLERATYFVIVSEKGTALKSFQVIKK